MRKADNLVKKAYNELKKGHLNNALRFLHRSGCIEDDIKDFCDKIPEYIWDAERAFPLFDGIEEMNSQEEYVGYDWLILIGIRIHRYDGTKYDVRFRRLSGWETILPDNRDGAMVRNALNQFWSIDEINDDTDVIDYGGRFLYGNIDIAGWKDRVYFPDNGCECVGFVYPAVAE